MLYMDAFLDMEVRKCRGDIDKRYYFFGGS